MRIDALPGPSRVACSIASALQSARNLRDCAYAPYSDYQVGAILVTEQGAYSGVNVEVSGRSTSIHAEMMAAFNAVMDGARDFKFIAISHDGDDAPCGLCQHTLSQFCEDLDIYVDSGEGGHWPGEPVSVEDSVDTIPPISYSLDELVGDGYAPSSRQENRDAMGEFVEADS